VHTPVCQSRWTFSHSGSPGAAPTGPACEGRYTCSVSIDLDPSRCCRIIRQTWNWVIGSPGQWVIWVIFYVRITGSLGHHFDPVWDPSFSGFRKNAQNAKRTFEMLKWQKSLSGVCCWTEITGCQFMQWTFTFTYDYEKTLWPENTSSHISRHLEFIIEQGHRVNWVSGSLDSWVTGSLGHKMWPSSISVIRGEKFASRSKNSVAFNSVAALGSFWSKRNQRRTE